MVYYQRKWVDRMLITEIVDIYITPRNVNHYKEKGYDIPTKYSEKVNREVIDSSIKVPIKTKDLPNNSHVRIKYQCDNCGKIFETSYSNWNNSKMKELGDLCKSCAAKIKLPEAMREIYGEYNSANVESITEKKKQTNLIKYGTEWAISSSQVRDKTMRTMLKTYGVSNPMQNEDIKNKAIATNNQKYGGNSSTCCPDVITKIKETVRTRYGVSNVYQNKKFQEKARRTRTANGNIPSSKPEMELCKRLKDLFGKENCFPSYQVGPLSLDCLVVLDDIKIDFEYDGYYWHKGRENKDRARNGALMKEGYKIVRVKANNQDVLPSDSQIMSAVEYLIKEDHHITFIDMNI